MRIPGEYIIPIITTRPHLGGTRYWFRCPVVRDGKRCGRRVRKLYLPPGLNVFGCRDCYHLTYRSVQEHDDRKYKLARNLSAVEAAIDSPRRRRQWLGFQALRLLFVWSRKRRKMTRRGCNTGGPTPPSGRNPLVGTGGADGASAEGQ